MIERYNHLFKITSQLNNWMDFIIEITKGNLDKAEELINEAYDSYWDDDDACNYTLIDWVSTFITEEFEYSIYTKEDEDYEY